MPALYTHYLFTKDVFDKLNIKTKSKIVHDIDLFSLFGQSFDILYFADRKLGSMGHHSHVNKYFFNIIKSIKKNNLINNSQTLAYLYGSICHYILDSTVHPYIFYKTGVYKGDKETKKYEGKHNYLEYMIDAIMCKRCTGNDIYRVNLKKEVFRKVNFGDKLKLVINDTFDNTFQVKNAFKKIKKGYFMYRFFVKYFMTSRFGIKKRFFNMGRRLHLPLFSKAYNCSYYIKKLDKMVLNLDNREWCYPVDKEVKYDYSFYDLYDMAVLKASKIIQEIDDILNSDLEEISRVINKLGNLDYSSGVDVNKHLKMKHFEY